MSAAALMVSHQLTAQTTVAPSITTQPASISVAAGANAAFSVVASGTAPLSYQWYKGDDVLSSGTAATLTLTAVSAASGGSYKVKVSNVAGNVTSTPATLTVTGVATVPFIATQPASVVVSTGATATFTVAATGATPLHYQWYKNDRRLDVPDAASLTLTSVKVDDAAIYTVKVSNTGGSVASAPAALTVNAVAGSISAAPASRSVKAGSDVSLTVTATGVGLTYQWKLEGRPLKSATTNTLTLANVSALGGGNYGVTVSNSAGAVASTAAAVTVTTDARLVNIATRGHVGDDDEVLISGFVTRGDGQKKILLRAVGPTLGTQFNVPEALAKPTLTLYAADRGNSVVATNSGWGGAASLSTVFVQVGAFPLPATSLDAALFQTLSSGAYSATVSAPRGTEGVALLEVYDADTGTPTAEVVNLSSRALVGAETKDTLIAGFAITGTSSDTVLVRGVGPSLGTLFGMRRALGASHVAVFDSKGNQVAANTVWTHGREGHDDDEDDATNDVETASDRAGAWKLPRGATDSALVLTLPPGVYTAHVTGVGKTGIGLVEVFEIH